MSSTKIGSEVAGLDTNRHWRRHFRHSQRSSHTVAVAGFVVLAALFFYPAVLHPGTRILAEPAGGDGDLFIWNMWAIPRAILHLHNPFATSGLFHPLGARTAFNTNIPLEGVASWPFAEVFGLPFATNVVQLAAVVLSGVGAYLLALHECGDRRAAFFAGAAFTYIPFRFAQLPGHHNLNHTEFLPFGILALLSLYERPSRKRAVVFGVLVGLTLLTDLNLTFFLLLAALIVAIWKGRATLTREMGLRYGQAGIAAAAVSAPLLVAMVVDLAVFHWVEPLTGWGGAQGYAADLTSWVIPSTYHPLWGSLFEAPNRIATGGERLAFPGYIVLLLAIAGVVLAGRGRRALWLAMFSTFFVLSLGPFLHAYNWTGAHFHYLGAEYSIPLPYFLLHFVPVANGVRVPGRFSIVGILALDVLAAIGLARIIVRRPRLGMALPAVAVALMLFEFLPGRVPTQPAAIPAPYSAIAGSPDGGAVLELPLQWRTGFTNFPDNIQDTTIFMYYATEHGRPLVSGMAARYPDRKLEELKLIPVYRQVLALQHAPGIESVPNFGSGDLRKAGIGFVVYHRDRPLPDSLRYFQNLGMSVLADDGSVLVWHVPASA